MTATVEEQITEAQNFPEPLMWIGANAPTQAESDALLAIVTNFPSATWKSDLLGYISTHASSPWTPSVRSSLAILCRNSGEYSDALTQWSNTWQTTKTFTNGTGKAVGDAVIAHWSQLLASLGRTNQLKPLFDETAGRQLDRFPHQALWRASKEGYQTMQDYPELAYRCGAFALINVAGALGMTNANIDSLKDEPSSGPGFSMAQLSAFAQQRGMGLVSVVRTNGTNLTVPSVIHWKQNHYAAITAEYGGVYWVKDPTFGGGLWMKPETINLEASGKFLVPTNQIPSGFRAMTQQEMDATWGQGQPNNIEDWKDHGCDRSPGGRGAPAKTPCPPCDVKGMPRWWVSEPYMNLWIADEPLSYTLSNGEEFTFRFTYKHRRDLPTGIRTTPTWTSRSTNTIWQHNFFSHLLYWDPYFEGWNGDPPGSYENYSAWTAVVLSSEGGADIYTSNTFAGDRREMESRSQVRLDRIGSLLYTGFPGFPNTNYFCPSPSNAIAGFRLTYPDGSEDWYTMTFPAKQTGASWATSTRAEALLTMRKDSAGRLTRICYEAYYNSYPYLYPSLSQLTFARVKHVIDPDGRTNTFIYGNDAVPRQLTQIVDPYGRTATMTYDPTSGILNSITDAAGNQTTFATEQISTNAFIGSMTTPYGTTLFGYYDVMNVDPMGGTQGNLGGHNRINRTVAVEEPNGAKHLYLYRYESTNHPSALPAAQAPVVSSSFLLDNGGPDNAPNKSELRFRNSFYWGPRTFPFPHITYGVDHSALSNLSSNDYRNARWRHWLDSSAAEATVVSDFLSLERLPSPDGLQDGHTRWFSYRGKFAAHRVGSTTLVGSSGDEHQLGLIAEVLPGGSTRYDEILYRSGSEQVAIPFPRETRSTHTKPDGATGLRTNLYVYHANKIDLHQVYGADGDIEETYLYNTNHQVTTFSNVLTETHGFTYDATTRNLTSVTTPGGLTITLNYYPTNAADPANRRMLFSVVQSPVTRVNSFNYQNGLPLWHTNELGLRLRYERDGLDRVTRVDYQDDGTFISNRYAKLDLVGSRDRLGNWTLFQYDLAQRLMAVTNANTNVTRLGWCGCGALEGITNALNQPTSFTYDQQSRRSSVLNADFSSLTYHHDPLGRLTSVTDGAAHALNYFYNNQGLLTAVSNAYGRVLGVTYDREDRPIHVTDADGVTVTNTFDALNRVTNRAWAQGVRESVRYTFGGTNIATINPLGHTNRAILDAALQLLWHTNANSEVTKFARNPAGQIVQLLDGGNHLTTWNRDQFGRVTSKVDALSRVLFRLTYDAANRVTNRWTPARGNVGSSFDGAGNLKTVTHSNASPYTISYTYDAADRLTNMADVVGATRFTYTASGRLDTEDGPWTSDNVSRSHIEGQRSALSLQQPLASAWSQTYGYDAARRMQSLASPAGSFGYAYGTANPASALVSRLTLPNSSTISNAFDTLARLTSTTLLSQWQEPLDGYGYIHDQWGQRINITRALGAARSTLALAYDAAGQLKTARAFESNGVPRYNEQLGYTYDAANNLQRRTNGALVQTFTPDAANQLGTLTRNNSIHLAALSTQPLTNASINSLPAELYGDLTFAVTNAVTLVNGVNTFTVVARNTGGVWVTNVLAVNLPGTQTFQHDANGNLTNDGTRAFFYDAENQLTNVTVTGAWRTHLVYDGLHRRRIRREYTWTGSAWNLTNETRYVYDGLLVLQERDANNIPLITYTRGLDLSGSLQGAGGVGGLLALSQHSTTPTTHFYYHTDGNGNVTALLNSGNEIAARYLYDPFGNIVSASGPMAGFNRHGFSSKERHHSGLLLYERRAYDPNLQRWINQDPIGEAGGINLYGFVRNNPVKKIDPLGLKYGNPVPQIVYYDPKSGQIDVGRESIFENPSPESAEIAATFAGIFLEPLDWVMTGREIYNEPTSPSSYAGLIPLVPAAAGKVIKKCPVKGYRAVSSDELRDIGEYGLRPHPDGRSMQDKWFSETAEGAAKFKEKFPDLEHIIEVEIPQSIYDKSFKHPNIDGTGPGFAVPSELLPEIPTK